MTKMIYLVRDPRAMYSSRLVSQWCKKSHDCKDPAVIRRDLVEDRRDADRLAKLYPERFSVVRCVSEIM